MKNELQFDWLKLSILIHIYWKTSICNIANVKHPFALHNPSTCVMCASEYGILVSSNMRGAVQLFRFGFFIRFICPFTIHFIFIWAAQYLFSLCSLLNECVSHVLAYYPHAVLCFSAVLHDDRATRLRCELCAYMVVVSLLNTIKIISI